MFLSLFCRPGVRNEPREVWDESRGHRDGSRRHRDEPRRPWDESRRPWDESRGVWDESRGVWDESRGVWDESRRLRATRPKVCDGQREQRDERRGDKSAGEKVRIQSFAETISCAGE